MFIFYFILFFILFIFSMFISGSFLIEDNDYLLFNWLLKIAYNRELKLMSKMTHNPKLTYGSTHFMDLIKSVQEVDSLKTHGVDNQTKFSLEGKIFFFYFLFFIFLFFIFYFF